MRLVCQADERSTRCRVAAGQRCGLWPTGSTNSGLGRRNEPSNGQQDGNADEQPEITGLYRSEHHPAM